MKQFFVGATINLTFSFEDYSSAEWQAELVLKSQLGSKVFLASGGEDGLFSLNLSALESSQIEPGIYGVVYRFKRGEEVAFETGNEICFIPDPTSTADDRSQFEKDLEALDRAIREKISGGAVEEYSIQTTVGQRSLKNMTLQDLRDHRRWLVGRVNRERVKLGKPPVTGDRWRQITSRLGNQKTVRRRRYR